MKKTSQTFDIAGKTLTLETGSLAGQATASVLARLGDTMVLVTIVSGKDRSDLGYFPLSVEYVERLYAGGRIKGSRWVKREGRPSDDAVLTARLIDRSIRPFFPKEYKNEVQIVITVLSVDGENEPDILSIIAVSAALTASSIPWKGPVSATRVGYVKEQGGDKEAYVINPGGAELALSELDLVATQTKEKTLMLEAGGLQVADSVVVEAIKIAHKQNKEILTFIEKFAKEVGETKKEVAPDTAIYEAAQWIEKNYKEEITKLVAIRANKEGGSTEYDDLITRIHEDGKMANPDNSADKKTVSAAMEKVFYKIIRENILDKGQRPDGRKVDEIRPISGLVGILPRTHGSAIFNRGTTQALTVVTLGSQRMEQLIETAEGEEKKSYIHHYSMPPYSVGEAGRMGTPSRREIGHGALAERAIMAVIPKAEVFPYTIRVVSEILSSNGSTSMASTCGSTMALMDAGVPIIKPVAGIAMGLMTRPGKEESEYQILTDIIGLEDFSGDMDFKVAGTDAGITAIQLDVKIAGLTIEQIVEIIEKAKAARMFILGKMHEVIAEPRKRVSTYAPKIETLKIPVEKIGELIGPGGRIIKNIIATTGATVDVEDDGTVSISGISEEQVQSAVQWVSGLTREVTVGEEFEDCEVKRILPFGAFVEFLPGKEGMVHVSQMSTDFVQNPADVVQIGQKVKVRVAEIDDQGRINLSMLFGEDANKPKQPRQSAPQSENRDDRAPHPLSQQFRRERDQREGYGAARPGQRRKRSF